MIKMIKELFGFAMELAFNSPYRSTARVRVVKGFLWFISGISATVIAARLINGLGATTHLSDVTPWGLWIGFDVVGGVALAAGGFIVAATVYIFHLHRYHAIVRPAVLTAFLGYCAVMIGLVFDLGLWFNIWRPMFYWQHHSALFEVAWCVMLYSTVLALEFAPVVLEKMPFPRLTKFMKTVTLPLVILGIMLSTLHQSSLGTLFLIMPFRLHPLWYSTLQPLLFFVSAIGLGLAMVTLEALVSGWLYRRPDELPLLSGLAKAGAVALGIYTVIRMGDLALSGKLALLVQPTWETAVFILEMLLCAIIPMILFAIPQVRNRKTGLLIGAATAVLGFVFNRINVSGISTITATGSNYLPSWIEFAVSAGVVSGAALVFFFFIEHFSVYEDAEMDQGEDISLPRPDPVSGTYLDSPWMGNGAVYSLIFILAAGLGFYLLPDDAVSGAQPKKTPVEIARTITATKSLPPGQSFSRLELAPRDGEAPAGAQSLQVLLLDANRDGRFVLFDHEGHQQRQGGKPACGFCHHLNRPFDQATPCSACHRDMFLTTDIFDHQLHQQKMGGNSGCRECHTDPAQPKTRANTTPCWSCHRAMSAGGSFVTMQDSSLQKPAAGYMGAMHGLCQKCHQQAVSKKPELSANFARCAACHQESDPDFLRSLPNYPAPENSPAASAKREAPGRER